MHARTNVTNPINIMKTIPSQLEQAFRAAIRTAFNLDADPQIAITLNDNFGDYQSNCAMSLARAVSEKSGQKTNPRAVAQAIVEALGESPMWSELSIAGPGFINVRLSSAWLTENLNSLRQDSRLGVDPATEPQKVVIDYSGPNVAKQMHVGHLRSSIIGDALSRVIEFQGHDVVRQNHIGDWGTQFGMLIAHLRYLGQEQSSHIEDLEAFYRAAKKHFDDDPAFQDEARATVVRLQAGEAAELALWERILEETRAHYQPIYQNLGVKLTRDDERGESFYNPFLPSVVADLKAAGIAEESEGAIVVFVEGHENPIIIEKTGGGYLYATTDLAAIRYRTGTLKAYRIIYTHDARQAQHFAMIFATARRAGWADGVQLDFAPFGTMLGEDNRPFKTRSGDTVKLKDLLGEAEERALALVTAKNPEMPEVTRRSVAHAVGIGGVKYSDLSKDRISDYVFSWDKMLAMDGNTAPYLQYVHARVMSIFRKAGTTSDPEDAPIDELATPQEQALAKHILRLGEIVDLVSRELKPHYLCIFLYDLATRFGAFYENCPVLSSPEPMRSTRLALCSLTARTMALGLDLLGIQSPEQM